MTMPEDVHPYRRPRGYLPRVAAVHDLCGYGKCSLGVAMPVLSAAGCDVCPVPTALFSAHTKFPTYYMHDTTPMLDAYLDAWQEEGVELDAVYSGFLGSAGQVAAIQRLWGEHPRALRFVDPVMGDGGRRYRTYTDEMCEATRGLVDGSDVLTPNITEASLLTGLPYPGQDVGEEGAYALLEGLLGLGARIVVLKGVMVGEATIRNYVAGRDMQTQAFDSPRLPFMIHGTGDLFASSLLGAIMAGRSLAEAVRFAGAFVPRCMEVTRLQPNYELRGVCFESELGQVADLLREG